MAKRLTIKTLLDSGHTQSDVASLTGVAERSVRRVAKEPTPTTLDDPSARRARGLGRPSKVTEVRDKVIALLAAEPLLPTTELFRRCKRDGFTGQKSAFFGLVAELRPAKPLDPLVRFEGVPGEFCQHDFGQVDVTFLDGQKLRVHFFASRLKYSRMAAVSLVPDETVESLARSVVAHYESFGGVPLVGVFDRPKTVALEWDPKTAHVTRWNSTFLEVMAELGVAPDACWPYRPNQKGGVENLVGWVKGSFFKCRRFADLEDLARQLAEWLHEVNTLRASRATREIPETRMAVERPRLRPLKVTSASLVLRFPAYVTPTATVSFKGAIYSMPPLAIGLPATVHLGKDHVRIVAGRHDVRHPRLHGDDARSILPEHRAAMIAAVNGRRGKLYLMRQQLMDLGPVVVDFLTEVVHRRPQRWSEDIGMLAMLHDLHGSGPLLSALTRARAQATFTARAVAAELGQPDLQLHPMPEGLQ